MNFELTLKPQTEEGQLNKLFFLYQEAVFPSLDLNLLVERVTIELTGESKGDAFVDNVNFVKNFKLNFKRILEDEYRRVIRESIGEVERSWETSFETSPLASKSKPREKTISDGSVRRSRNIQDSKRKLESDDTVSFSRELENAVREAISESERAKTDRESKKRAKEAERESSARDAEERANKYRFKSSDSRADETSFES